VLGIASRKGKNVCLQGMSVLHALFLIPGCVVSFDSWPDRVVATGGQISNGGTGTGGASSIVANGGAGGTLGGTSSIKPSMTGGTPATGGNNPTGGTSSQSTVESVVWLTFEGAEANAATLPNGSLGINGVVYAYSDSCASVSFNPLTRCVSGTLCDVGSSFQNWGVAIGFDFVNTGSAGAPPNAKLTWNPTTHNALGVAWHITNLVTSRLQLWVLDMDPSWQGTCTSDTCSIQGPPDGASQIGTDGKLYFNSMIKDDWGGSGIIYTYSPASTYSLQFKIPTVIVGAEVFQFCVDKLGIIVN
jgi:hypothetical protein